MDRTPKPVCLRLRDPNGPAVLCVETDWDTYLVIQGQFECGPKDAPTVNQLIRLLRTFTDKHYKDTLTPAQDWDAFADEVTEGKGKWTTGVKKKRSKKQRKPKKNTAAADKRKQAVRKSAASFPGVEDLPDE